MMLRICAVPTSAGRSSGSVVGALCWSEVWRNGELCRIWAWDFYLNKKTRRGLYALTVSCPCWRPEGEGKEKIGEYQVELGIITKFSLDVLIMAWLYFAARNATSKGPFCNIYRRKTVSAIFFNVIRERKIGIKHGWGYIGQEQSWVMGPYYITLLI